MTYAPDASIQNIQSADIDFAIYPDSQGSGEKSIQLHNTVGTYADTATQVDFEFETPASQIHDVQTPSTSEEIKRVYTSEDFPEQSKRRLSSVLIEKIMSRMNRHQHGIVPNPKRYPVHATVWVRLGVYVPALGYREHKRLKWERRMERKKRR